MKERWGRVVIERGNMAFQERVRQISEVRLKHEKPKRKTKYLHECTGVMIRENQKNTKPNNHPANEPTLELCITAALILSAGNITLLNSSSTKISLLILVSVILLLSPFDHGSDSGYASSTFMLVVDSSWFT
jgi:hypothetical protein